MMKWMILTLLLCIVLAFSACVSTGGSYNPGVYTATAPGFGGNITVTLEVNSSKIVSINAEGPYETLGIGSVALDQLPKRMVSANSVAVDSLSGATYTCEGIIEAAKAALEQAK